MRLLFRQRMFSWFDSYDIYDENGNTVYVVKGQLSWGHLLNIYDAYENKLGYVQERVLTFCLRKTAIVKLFAEILNIRARAVSWLHQQRIYIF